MEILWTDGNLRWRSTIAYPSVVRKQPHFQRLTTSLQKLNFSIADQGTNGCGIIPLLCMLLPVSSRCPEFMPGDAYQASSIVI
jgi:hypothetical protein